MSAASAPPSTPHASSTPSSTPGPAAGPPSPNWHWASALAGALAAAILLGGAVLLWSGPTR
ncbi:MAG TPA: hypothetical protein VNK95_02560, partial [Caldilineaceae bacterium]|nr:hypothetical protein [Caldilineaceae bacterium]